MARNIQAISGAKRESLRGLWRGLWGVVFWIAVAVLVPFDRLSGLGPAWAPVVPWLPVAAFALALLSLVGALRSLGRLAQAMLRQPGRQPGGIRAAAAPRPDMTQPGMTQPGMARAGKSARVAPAIRAPTVQRMR